MIHALKGNDDGIIRVFTLCQKILKILIQQQNILIVMSWLEQTIENESHRNLLNTSYSMPLFKYIEKIIILICLIIQSFPKFVIVYFMYELGLFKSIAQDK